MSLLLQPLKTCETFKYACQNIAIIEYELTRECPYCNLEFDKRDFEKCSDENILAIEEKKNCIEMFKKIRFVKCHLYYCNDN